MLNSLFILVRGLVLGAIAVVLLACGQKGALYLPSGPAATDRATLPQSLRPGSGNAAPAAAAPASSSSAPAAAVPHPSATASQPASPSARP